MCTQGLVRNQRLRYALRFGRLDAHIDILAIPAVSTVGAGRCEVADNRAMVREDPATGDASLATAAPTAGIQVMPTG